LVVTEGGEMMGDEGMGALLRPRQGDGIFVYVLVVVVHVAQLARLVQKIYVVSWLLIANDSCRCTFCNSYRCLYSYRIKKREKYRG
jgi:hypothetical protein